MAATTAGKVKWEAIFVCFCLFIGKPVTLHDLINNKTQLRGKLGSCYNEVFIFVQYVSWKSMIAPMTAYIATHAYDRGSTFAVQDLRKSPKKKQWFCRACT